MCRIWPVKREKNRSSSIFKAHLYCHLASEGVPIGDSVPRDGRESGLKLLKRRNYTQKSHVQWHTLFLSLLHTRALSHTQSYHIRVYVYTRTQSAPAEEQWCEQEASICRPRGVHRPQGKLQKREKKLKPLSTGSNMTICMAGGSIGIWQHQSHWEQLTPSFWGST